jgi:SNF2 family DNA or RNA helicase
MASAIGTRAGAAYIELSVSDAKLLKGLYLACKRLKAFGAGLRAVGTHLMAVGGGIVAPLLASAKGYAEVGEQLDKMSTRTGISVEALSELGYAAKLSDVSLEEVGVGVRNMQRVVAGAARGSDSREMLSRRLLRRILIVTPAGLLGNWRRELRTLFNLPFTIVSGDDARHGNPFTGDASDRVIVSVDTLSSPRVLGRLRESDVVPYDLVIFDEAHKLSADRGSDMRVRKIDRYCLGEALAGVRGLGERWNLG